MKRILKIILINLLVLIAILAAIELIFIISNKIENFRHRKNKDIVIITDTITNQIVNEPLTKVINSKLGYGPRPNSIIHSEKIRKGKVVYSVNYTVDEQAHRLASNPLKKPQSNQAILFFGCSFMYGEGVNDNESLPYAFSELTKNQYPVYNLAFSSYGPNQMLAILENNLEKKALGKNKVKQAYYAAISHHINRAATTSEVANWGRGTAPKYILENGQAKYFGSTADYTKSLESQIQHDANADNKYFDFLLKIKKHAHSHLVDYVFSKLNIVAKSQNQKTNITDEDRELFVKIVEKSRDLIQKKYRADFTVILWDLTKHGGVSYLQNDEDIEYIKKGFKKLGIKYVLVSDILSDYKTNYLNYTIKGDGHPSAIAQKKLAEYLQSNL